MSQSSIDETRLRAAEASMRRALGLQDQPAPADRATAAPVAPSGPGHRTPRRFVRDGEVPVTVIHREHEDAAGVNKLESTRQALREQTTARQHAEQLLQEAQATIRDLQTKLAHERMARAEGSERVAADLLSTQQALQATRDELATERAARLDVETERDHALAECASLTQRLKGALAVQKPQGRPAKSRRPAEPPAQAPLALADETDPEGGAGFVEWWKPGWQDKFR